MPGVLRHNQSLELNLAEYFGSVTYGELKAVAAYLGSDPAFLRRDCLNVIHPDCNFDRVDPSDLDELFRTYTALFAPLSFQIMRRSAWVCLSPVTQRYIDHWIVGRDARRVMSTTVRQFSTYEEAGEWLVLSEAETLALQTRTGFDIVASFDDGAGIAASNVR